MNPFEKIFNFQLLSRLEDTGTVAVTAQERTWLKMMLGSEEAKGALDPSTREKLVEALDGEPDYQLADVLTEKAGPSSVKALFPDTLRLLRNIIVGKGAARITYRIKGGKADRKESCFPYKLEYSMVKGEWYLLWYNRRHRSLMSTKLVNILEVEPVDVSREEAERLYAELTRMLEIHKEAALIEVIRRYNPELSRILYAFSCFDKEVEYEEAADLYRIRLYYLNNEREYVLSKLRFLGMRVRVVEGEHLKRRMLESASKALARYKEEEAGD